MTTRFRIPIIVRILVAACAAWPALAQTPLTWDQVKTRFEAANPTLRAGQLNIAESKTLETTAYLKPNPNMGFAWTSSSSSMPTPTVRLASCFPSSASIICTSASTSANCASKARKKATAIAESQQLDLERTMLFSLRSAFVQTLQAKQLLLPDARESGLLQQGTGHLPQPFSGRRHRARRSGPHAPADARNTKAIIKALWSTHAPPRSPLRLMLNDQTPVDKFDVTGPFEFKEQVLPLDEFHKIAEAARPDLKAAVQAVDEGADGPPAGRGQRLHRPHLRHGFCPQSAHPALRGLQRQHSLAHLRPQPGREGAHRRSISLMRSGRKMRRRPRSSATWIRPTSPSSAP